MFDRMSYEGPGLEGFGANEALGAEKPSTVLSHMPVSSESWNLLALASHSKDTM
jgi:hypothetical protein